MLQCTSETTQTTMDATLTTSFLILAKTFMHTIYKVQRNNQFIRLWFTAKKLILLYTNEATQTTIFSIDDKNVLTLKTTYTNSFS